MQTVCVTCLLFVCWANTWAATVGCVDVYAQTGTSTPTGYTVTLVFLYSYCFWTGEPGAGVGDPPPPDPDPGGVVPTQAPVANTEEFIDCLSDILPYMGAREYIENAHQGIDLKAYNATLIRSPVNGVVTFVQDDIPRDHNITVNPGALIGNQIAIQPLNAYTQSGPVQSANPDAVISVILEHLDPGIFAEFGIKKGTVVSIGQIIARSDNTGSTNIGPHLHLGLRKGNGEYIDPRMVIPCE